MEWKGNGGMIQAKFNKNLLESPTNDDLNTWLRQAGKVGSG